VIGLINTAPWISTIDRLLCSRAGARTKQNVTNTWSNVDVIDHSAEVPDGITELDVAPEDHFLTGRRQIVSGCAT
jgi:hypothetical protein